MFDQEDFKNLIKIAKPPTDNITIEAVAAKFANLLILAAGIIAFLYLVYVGILYITAAGNQEQAVRAQRGFVNIIIGIIIISLSYLIILYVSNLAQQIGV